MIATWRAHWGAAGTFAWLTTQIGDQGVVTGASYVATPRDAQQVVVAGRYPGVSRTPAAGLVAAYDRGDYIDDPYGNVHSRFKGDIGRRMALLFRNLTGLGPTPLWDGPRASAVSSATDGSIALTWSLSSSGGGGGGVSMNGTQDCWECCDGTRALDVFQVRGGGRWRRPYPDALIEDPDLAILHIGQVSPTLPGPNFTAHQAWTNASWTYDAGTATVTLTPVAPPAPGLPWAVVRYGANMWPQCAWYSVAAGVPAMTFSDMPVKS
jgi:hypothetical protein